MADLSSSPAKSPKTPLPRVPSLKAFLPDPSTAISTRGQNLPALIQSHSTGRALSRRSSQVSFSDGDDDLESGRHFGLTMPWGKREAEERRISAGAQALNTPQMRSQRLIGNSNPRYKWERHYKSEEELKHMKKPIRQYYERNNYLIQHYLYIDRLLDSSLPHNLIQEYHTPHLNIPSTIAEESTSSGTPCAVSSGDATPNGDTKSSYGAMGCDGSNCNTVHAPQVRLKRTPKNLYKVPDEETPLLTLEDADTEEGQKAMPDWEPEEETDNQDPIVTLAIYVNLAANTALLIMKIVVTIMTSSLSVIASLVDAALDFLSTFIVWVTSWMISKEDKYAYPVGQRRLEPLGVLVFSIIMVTSFFQVAMDGFRRLMSDDRTVVELTIPAVAIMASTVIIKFACWFWCRMIRNSSVQALAQDAMTDVVFNIFSIIFPLVGFFANIWWLDPLGGILLSIYVIVNWSSTSLTHIRNLTGAAATADERNILLYLTMRFAKSIKQIQGIQAYHAGDKLNVEVDVVLDEGMTLRDSHDLGESLQYVLESVPYVDRAFVHLDYTGYNLPTHMAQQG